MPYIRQDMALITLTLAPAPRAYKPPKGYSWSNYSGGEMDSDDTKIRPGGMGREVAAGGPATRGDITLQTQLTDLNWGWIAALESVVGNGPCVVGVNFKPTRATVGAGFTRNGIVKTVTPPEFDSNGSDPAILEVVISCNE